MTSVALRVTRAAAAPCPKPSELRTLASPSPPRPSTRAGVCFALGDYGLLCGGLASVVIAPWWAVKVMGAGVAGVAAAMLFALAHDAALRRRT